jgi:hypothetical protein
LPEFPYAQYGVDVGKIPDYVEPFVAYRAWHWTAEGITSLNNAMWKPKVAFEAMCVHQIKIDDEAKMKAILQAMGADHPVPNERCTCGMYAGINMQHLKKIGYIQYGIHGEVYLWGRLYKHTLGWRAQYAYPKFFVIPSDMLPFTMQEIQTRLKALIEYGVDIYLEDTYFEDPNPLAEGGNIPLWIKDYGYSQQGISYLIHRAQNHQSESTKIKGLEINDRIVILGSTGNYRGGIGIARYITDSEIYYTLYRPDVYYRKDIGDIKWSEPVGLLCAIGVLPQRPSEPRAYRENRNGRQSRLNIALLQVGFRLKHQALCARIPKAACSSCSVCRAPQDTSVIRCGPAKTSRPGDPKISICAPHGGLKFFATGGVSGLPGGFACEEDMSVHA